MVYHVPTKLMFHTIITIAHILHKRLEPIRIIRTRTPLKRLDLEYSKDPFKQSF